MHERHGGVVEKFIGDAVMAVFGIPRAREDDALRAVRAAAELGEAVAMLNRELESELEVTLAIRTGVSTGLVLAGDERAGHAFVGGDTVNLAARLERAAGAGQVLLGEATYRLVAGAVRAQPLARFVPRGRSAPVAAYRLLEVVADAPGLPRRLDAPLVGRSAELAVLQGMLDRAVAQEACQLVTVVGDPGVGKSRLLRAFAERAADRALVLEAACPAYGVSAATQVAGQIIAAAAPGDRRAWPAEVAATDPRGLFAGLRRLLERLAADRPVVVVVDDLHWADPLLLDLLEYLALFARDAALLLVAAGRRPADGQGRPAGRDGPGPARPGPAAGRRGRRAGHRPAGGQGGSTASDWPWPRATRCSSSRRWATATAPPRRWSGPSWTSCRPRSGPCWRRPASSGRSSTGRRWPPWPPSRSPRGSAGCCSPWPGGT